MATDGKWVLRRLDRRVAGRPTAGRRPVSAGDRRAVAARADGGEERCWNATQKQGLAVGCKPHEQLLVAGARNRRYLQLWSGAA
jgi:hypothetical protein